MKILNKKSSKLNKGVSLLLALAIFVVAMVIDLPDGSSEVNAYCEPVLQIDAHVQDYGWDPSYYAYCPSGKCAVAGTTGQAKRLEAIRIGIGNTGNVDGYICAEVRYFDGKTCKIKERPGSSRLICGTVGESKPIEAIRLWFEGEMGRAYRLSYTVHVQDKGWLDGGRWIPAGNWAGTRGNNLRLEAIKVRFN